MRSLLLVAALALAACGTDTAPAADPPLATETSADTEMDMASIDSAALAPTTLVSDPPMPAGPELIAEGTFSGASDHDVSGRALLYRLDDGSHTLRLEGLDSDNGPDLRVWLLTDLADKASGRIDLGELKSTAGDQNYPVPTGADVSDVVGVSVWCRAFSVEFGTATLG